ncbi:hypothetical protein [Streptomyces sp. NBRC 109706]|uniref:hypothetical protein n=1 Tax=Streptomyces sp. NBRC 109706 TaxID=1550035 RepID=UPI0007821E3A|nr:hypothetical protein [Streptomyces sp. NBRC 109706]
MKLTERLARNRAEAERTEPPAQAPAEAPKDLSEGGTGTTPHPVAAGGVVPAPERAPDRMVGSGERRAVAPLFSPEEADRLRAEVKGAVAGFVDGPGESVATADAALEQAVARLTEELANRRRALRDSWQGPADEPDAAGDTEAQRTALRDYRDLLELLVRI